MNLVWMRKISLVSATFSYPPQPRHFHECSMLSENIPSSRAFTAFTLTGVVFTPNTGNVNVSLENPCMQLEWLLFWTFKSHNTTAELEIRSESCKWLGELGVWDTKFKLTLEKPRNDNFLICVVSFDDCDGLPESLMTTNALSSCHTQSNHWVLLGISKNSHTRVRRSIITHSQNSTYFSTPIFSTLFPLVVFTVITIAKLTANWTANCSSRTFLNYFFFPTSLSCGRYVSCAAVWFSIFHLFFTHIEHFFTGPSCWSVYGSKILISNIDKASQSAEMIAGTSCFLFCRWFYVCEKYTRFWDTVWWCDKVWHEFCSYRGGVGVVESN